MRKTIFSFIVLLSTFAAAQSGPFVISSASSVCASIGVGGPISTVTVEVEGTFSMTLQPEISIFGRSPANSQVSPSTSSAPQATITAAGYYRADVSSYSLFEVCPTSYASGTATIYLYPGNGTIAGGGSSGVTSAVTQSGTWNVGQTGTWTVTATQATGTNLHVVLDTTSTTAVTQATGTNLHAVLDSASIESTDMTGTVSGTAPSNTKLVGAIFNSANVTPSTGQVSPLQQDSQGDLDVINRPIANCGNCSFSISNQAALTTAVNLKASAGSLYGFIGAYDGAAAGCFLQFMNSATGTLGTAPVFSVQLPFAATAAGNSVSLILPMPLQFSAGVAVGMSTTDNGSTACGTAGSVTVLFK